MDDSRNGALHLLEALELIEVGIEGKRALWRALAATADQASWLHRVNFDHLIQRAVDQHGRVEEARVAAAKRALVAA